MLNEYITDSLEARINKHITQGLDTQFTEETQWNIEMANKWMRVLSNYRKLSEK